MSALTELVDEYKKRDFMKECAHKKCNCNFRIWHGAMIVVEGGRLEPYFTLGPLVGQTPEKQNVTKEKGDEGR